MDRLYGLTESSNLPHYGDEAECVLEVRLQFCSVCKVIAFSADSIGSRKEVAGQDAFLFQSREGLCDVFSCHVF